MTDRTGRILAYNGKGKPHYYRSTCGLTCTPVDDEVAAAFIWGTQTSHRDDVAAAFVYGTQTPRRTDETTDRS